MTVGSPTAPPLRARALGLAAFAVVALVGGQALPRGVMNWDNVVKMQLAGSLQRGDGLVLRHLTPDDAAYVQIGKDGRRYAPYPPLAAALHILTIQVGFLTGLEAEGVPAIFLLGLVAWALVSWGRREGMTDGAAVVGAVLACLGTSLWPMATAGYDVLAEVLALALVLRAGAGETHRTGPWLLAGLALGGAFATRLGAAVLAFPAAAVALAAPPRDLRSVARRAAALAVGGLPGVLLVLWHNVYRFGSPFVVYQTSALGTFQDLAAPWLSWLHLQGMSGLLVSPGKGLLWYAPPMLLVVAAAPALARRHRPAAIGLAVYLAAAVVLFGRFRYWHGDWGWGPRYVAPVLVAAAPLGWLAVERAGAALGRRAVLAGALLALMSLQAIPVVVRPVLHHFRLVVLPLEAEGRLATRPVTRPPGPEDYEIHYYAPQHSMLVSIWGGLAASRAKLGFWWRVLRVAAVPAAALGLVWLAGRARGPVPRGGPEVAA